LSKADMIVFEVITDTEFFYFWISFPILA